jgi:hypothetical protein
LRLHPLFAIDATPRALALSSPKIDQQLACLQTLARCEPQPGQALILTADKNLRGKNFETELAELDATILRPRRTGRETPRPAPRADPASASNRSSGPPSTSSPSSVMAPAPSRTSASDSAPDPPRSPPP